MKATMTDIGTEKRIIVLNGKRNRRERLRIKRCLRAGMFNLRIVGSEATGFRLGAQNPAGDTIKVFGFVYSKQSHAAMKGQMKYGVRAVKYAPNSARTQVA